MYTTIILHRNVKLFEVRTFRLEYSVVTYVIMILIYFKYRYNTHNLNFKQQNYVDHVNITSEKAAINNSVF